MLYSVYPYIHWNYPPHAHSALRILRCGAAAPVGGRLRQDHHGGEGAAHHIPHHQVGGPLPILGGIDRRGGARGDGGVEDVWKWRGGVCERKAPRRGGSF